MGYKRYWDEDGDRPDWADRLSEALANFELHSRALAHPREIREGLAPEHSPLPLGRVSRRGAALCLELFRASLGYGR